MFDFSMIDPSKLYELAANFKPDPILAEMNGAGLNLAQPGGIGLQLSNVSPAGNPMIPPTPAASAPPAAAAPGSWDWLTGAPKLPATMPTPPATAAKAPLSLEQTRMLQSMMPKPQNPNEVRMMPPPSLPGRPGAIQMAAAQFPTQGGYSPVGLAQILNGRR